MDVQRLVVEEARGAQAIDFHPGLTVAHHENPAVRARFLTDLVDSLGPARSGLHVEVTDAAGHALAVFRPHGGHHRAVDIDRSFDVSSQYAAPGHGIDLLGRLGLDPATGFRLMRLTALQVHRGVDTETDDHRLARHLAGLDPRRLWPAAEEAVRAAEQLRVALEALPAGAEQVANFERLQAVHGATEAAEREHRRNRRFGGALAGLCGIAGVLLLVFDGVVDDRSFTARALLVLCFLATALVALDARRVGRARRTETEQLAPLGAASFAEYAASVGPLADDERRRELHDAATADQAARVVWRATAGDCSPAWALDHRPAVERLIVQRTRLARLGAEELAAAEGGVSDSARVLADKVIELREVGFARERLPLLLDEPFVGLEQSEAEQLLDTTLRLSQEHQVVLVTGDPFIRAWATEQQRKGTAKVVRLNRGAPAVSRV